MWIWIKAIRDSKCCREAKTLYMSGCWWTILIISLKARNKARQHTCSASGTQVSTWTVGRNGSAGCVAAKKPCFWLKARAIVRFLVHKGTSMSERKLARSASWMLVSVELSDSSVMMNAEKYEKIFTTHAVKLGKRAMVHCRCRVTISQNNNYIHQWNFFFCLLKLRKQEKEKCSLFYYQELNFQSWCIFDI